MGNNHMKISEFAEVTGITRRNLLFYDKIGLLSPAKIDENNKYRYYTDYQVDTASIINILREIGMPLKEIKEYLNGRSPENFIQLFKTQKKSVENKIKRLSQISDMMDTRIHRTENGQQAGKNIDSIILEECESIPIFCGLELPADSHTSEGWYYINDFYEFCEAHQLIRGLPVGTIIDYKDLLQGKFVRPSRYYYRPMCGSSCPNNAEKPKGLYVIGQEYISYGNSGQLYSRLNKYIEKAKLKICGHAYEEYLLDETSIKDPAQYLLQVAIHVQNNA